MPDRYTESLGQSVPPGGPPGHARKDERVDRQPLDPYPHAPTRNDRKLDGAGNLTWDDEEGR